ncbi:MAG: hypothetical protein RBG13Loki_0108 [Promethearchaeota archaeon CR_4]|nr:MAG: hypothetical protein RBG13Loki_0108 [Candidatus Lokiarchaeota archaeon CR_4]
MPTSRAHRRQHALELDLGDDVRILTIPIEGMISNREFVPPGCDDNRTDIHRCQLVLHVVIDRPSLTRFAASFALDTVILIDKRYFRYRLWEGHVNGFPGANVSVKLRRDVYWTLGHAELATRALIWIDISCFLPDRDREVARDAGNFFDLCIGEELHVRVFRRGNHNGS